MSQDNVTTPALESGMKLLSEDGWLPPRIDLEQLIEHVERGEVSDELAFDLRNRPVELLATSFAALTRKRHKHSPNEWLALESLGLEVSPAFAELGSLACNAVEGAIHLHRGEEVRPLWWESICRSVGELWSAAFDGPDGYAQYIARSMAGREPPGRGFFLTAAPSWPPADPALGARYLTAMLDLLQAGIASNNLPDRRVGALAQPISLDNPICMAGMLHVGIEHLPIIVHSKREAVPGGVRLILSLRQGFGGPTIASIGAVILRAETGRYDEYLDLGASVNETVGGIVSDVFAPTANVHLAPRVRAILDEAGNSVSSLAVIEHAVVAKRWRKRRIGQRMVEQLVAEAGDIQMALARTAPARLGDAYGKPSRGVQAGYPVGAIKLASSYARQLGGQYLIHSIMGIPPVVIDKLKESGRAIRTPL